MESVSQISCGAVYWFFNKNIEFISMWIWLGSAVGGVGGEQKVQEVAGGRVCGISHNNR